MIIVCQRLLKNTHINAITLYPFIILRRPEDRRNAALLNHEKIHLRQQAELLLLFFYLWYVVEYYAALYRLGDADKAYRSISFEREAYAMERDQYYLSKRKFWAFLHYRR